MWKPSWKVEVLSTAHETKQTSTSGGHDSDHRPLGMVKLGLTCHVVSRLLRLPSSTLLAHRVFALIERCVPLEDRRRVLYKGVRRERYRSDAQVDWPRSRPPHGISHINVLSMMMYAANLRRPYKRHPDLCHAVWVRFHILPSNLSLMHLLPLRTFHHGYSRSCKQLAHPAPFG